MRSCNSRGGKSPMAWAMTRPWITTTSVGAELHEAKRDQEPATKAGASPGRNDVMPIWAAARRPSAALRTRRSKLVDEHPKGDMQMSSMRGMRRVSLRNHPIALAVPEKRRRAVGRTGSSTRRGPLQSVEGRCYGPVCTDPFEPVNPLAALVINVEL